MSFIRCCCCPASHIGLISALPGKANAGLQAASRTIEAMVAAKASHPELILLCLEDCNDWTHATTRRLAMQVCVGEAHNSCVEPHRKLNDGWCHSAKAHVKDVHTAQFISSPSYVPSSLSNCGEVLCCVVLL